MSDFEFSQWFSGFTDGEGSFSIYSTKTAFNFRFIIKLHIDDIAALEFIKSKLNSGNVFIRKDNSASFELNRISDIHSILIPQFEKFPLNGTKYLDYLAFKKAVETKLDSSLSETQKLEIITALKNSMNSNRVEFEMPSTHTIRITPYYLLGLFEGV